MSRALYDDVAVNQSEVHEFIGLLHACAAGHPHPNVPFLALMGRVLTPTGLYERAVAVDAYGNRRLTDYGDRFLRYLVKQGERVHEPWQTSLHRALAANQIRRWPLSS